MFNESLFVGANLIDKKMANIQCNIQITKEFEDITGGGNSAVGIKTH